MPTQANKSHQQVSLGARLSSMFGMSGLLGLLGLLGLGSALALGGCTLRGSGTEMAESRELESFDSIELGGAFDLVVHVAPDSTQKVVVSGDDNVLPKILTTVSGNELELRVDHWMVRPATPMKVEVWVPSLTKVDASGAAEIDVEGLHGDRFDLIVAGASEATLSGAVDHFEVDSSGASEINARTLQAKVVEVELSGAGVAEVWVLDKLEVEVSGAGKVRYWGEPASINEDVSGAGSVEPG